MLDRTRPPRRLEPEEDAPVADRRARCLMAYAEGGYGLRLRAVFLDGLSPYHVHEILVEASFDHLRIPLPAERTPTNEPSFRTRDGNVALDGKAPEVVPVDVYVHEDHSIVRLFSLGDPTGRRAPRAMSTAWKSFALIAPLPGRRMEPRHAAFNNDAFRVTRSGEPLSDSGAAGSDAFRRRQGALAETCFRLRGG